MDTRTGHLVKDIEVIDLTRRHRYQRVPRSLIPDATALLGNRAEASSPETDVLRVKMKAALRKRSARAKKKPRKKPKRPW